MAPPLFTIAAGPASGAVPMEEITDYDGWSLDNNLDDGCSFQFSSQTEFDPTYLSELMSDIWLYRDGVLYQRFRVTNIQQDYGPNIDLNLSVSAACYRRLLKSRHVRSTLTYAGVSQGDIVWNLVQHAQAATNGSLGITLGNAGPVVPRDRTYQPGTNIFDAITELTQIDNGLTWNITPQRQLVVSQPSLYPVIANPIQIGVTARRMLRPSSAERFANAALVTGDSMSTTLQIAEAPGLPIDARGRWERYQSLSQVKEQAQLAELADGLVQQSISPVTTWRIEMEPSRFFFDIELQLGDLVTIITPNLAGSFTPLNGQVLSRNISQDGDGNTTVIVNVVELP